VLRNPRAFGGGDSHPSLATHTGIRTPRRSTDHHQPASPLTGTLPYQGPAGADPSVASVTDVSPVGFSAPRHIRPVSYYALFEGWLLLSQPPGCLRAATSLPTQSALRDLSRRSRLFPSRRRIFAPAASLPRYRSRGIRRLVRVGRRQAPSPIQCSTPAGHPEGCT
jgi:hypothetical protein